MINLDCKIVRYVIVRKMLAPPSVTPHTIAAKPIVHHQNAATAAATHPTKTFSGPTVL